MNSEENHLSSDDDLPDLYGNSDLSKKKFEITQHDIVWALYRKQYWPAIVRCVKKKEKQASIWYLDSPKKCFKVPFNKIKSFSDPQIIELVKKTFENSPIKDKHRMIWLSAITYIRRKAQGYNDDPASYFDVNDHYLANKDKDSDAHCSSEIKISDVSVKQENSDPTSSDEESLVSDDEEEKIICKKLSTFTTLEEEDEPEVDNIVQCIVAGYVDKHLLQIKSKKVPSNYQELYENAMKTDRKKLMHITPTNHVNSTKNLSKIAIYLINFYEKVIVGGKCGMIDYILCVWVPEAIIKAVELIDKGSFNISEPIPESRKELIPTDKLIYGEIYNPINSIENDSIEKANGKKRGRPKGKSKKRTFKKQPKKVKICDDNVKISDDEKKLTLKFSINNRSKLVSKSSEKIEVGHNAKSRNEEEGTNTKSPNKTEKTPVKSLTVTLRSSPRKKV